MVEENTIEKDFKVTPTLGKIPFTIIGNKKLQLGKLLHPSLKKKEPQSYFWL